MKKRKKTKLERKLIRNMLIIFLIIMLTTSTTILVAFFEGKVQEKSLMLSEVAENVKYDLARPFTVEERENMTGKEMQQSYSERSRFGIMVDNWLENGPDADYYGALERMIQQREECDLSDIFIYKAKVDDNGELINDMTIIFDTPNSEGIVYSLGDDFGPSVAFETIKKVYETDTVQVFDKVAINESGLVMVAYAPLNYRESGVCAVIGVEAAIKNIVWEVLGDNYFLLINNVVDFLICIVVVILFLRKSIVKPVHQISTHINRFVSDEGALLYEPITEIHTRDEIEQIADDFNSLAQRTINYTQNLEIKTTEEERLRVDLDVAKQIRSVISSEPTYPAFPERSDFDLCASMRHTRYNKCSFCNYFFTDTNRLVIIIGESLGDSLAAMIFSVLSVSYIKCFAKMGFDPYKIAVETNNQLCTIEKKDAGLTVGAIIADVDLKTGTMRYVNAGMPPMLIKKPGEAFVLARTEVPFSLGQMRGVSFEQNTLLLSQGSTVFFTSFGITEMSDPSGNKYGFERLIDVMNRITGNVYDLDKALQELEEDLDSFRCDSPVPLDTAVLGFRYFG